MVKQKRKAEAEEKVKEKVSPSPNALGITNSIEMATQQQPQDVTVGEGEPAQVIPTEGGGTVQVGQFGTPVERTAEDLAARAVHPELGRVYQSNIVSYKGRKTRFLTIPKKLVEDELFPFKGNEKTQPVKITRTTDGNKLIVERL
jgi:hypothetical protein